MPAIISLLILLVILTLSWTAYFGVRRASQQVGQERLKALIEQFRDIFQASSDKLKTSTTEMALQKPVTDFLLNPAGVDLTNYFKNSPSLQGDTLTKALQVLDRNKAILYSSIGYRTSFPEVADSVFSNASANPNFNAIGKIQIQRDTMIYPVVVSVKRNSHTLGYLIRWRLLLSNRRNIQNINKLLGEDASIYVGNADNSFWTNFTDPVSVHDFSSGKNPGEYTKPDNNRVFGAFSTIPGTPWAYIIELSRNAILEASDRFLRWMLTIDFIVLLGGFALTWFVSRRITAPINKLSSAAGRIAEGNYQQPVEIKRKDELGQLAEAFNTMSEKIRYSKTELENTVKERTSQLESANKELDELNHKLQELDQLKTNFFTNISHELRTPLTLILGPLERLRKDNELSGNSRRQLQVIHRNAGVLLKQVNNLLDLSRLEAGKLRLNYEEFDLVKLINIIAAQFELYKNERDINLLIKAPKEIIIQADSEKIERIITNLIANAFKFTPVGGRIAIEASPDEEEAVVKIRDSGPGIEPALLEGIFVRFQGTDVYLGGNSGSSGLGLSIAREFIELHKGKIHAVNSDKGGAEFIISLPLTAANIKEAGQNPLPRRDRVELRNTAIVPPYHEEVKQLPVIQSGLEQGTKKNARILVVEDNADMSEFITGVLSDKYQVECAFNGAEGLEKALVYFPDLIISDIMMPVMSGNDMIRKLKENHRTKDIPVLILSAKTEDVFRMEMLKSGAQDYLNKPFSIEELKVRTNNIIEIKLSKDLLRKELDRYSESLSQLVEELAEKKHMLESSLSEKTILLKEIHHRVKNNLQIIASLLSLQSSSIKDPAVLEVFKESQNRIRSMALIHEKLYSSRDGFAKINLRGYIDDLIKYLFRTYRISSSKVRLNIEVPEIIISLDSAVSIGLILSELITNSIKYALNENGEGNLSVMYKDEDGTGTTISVSDTGKGMSDVKEQVKDTLGMVIISSLIDQLKGTYEIISNNGTEVRIRFPYSLTGSIENEGTLLSVQKPPESFQAF